MCKLAQTSETAIAITFLVMNLEKWLKIFIFLFQVEQNLYGLVEFVTKWQQTIHQKKDGEVQEKLSVC